MKVKYDDDAPFAEVEVPAFGIIAKRGEPVEVPDEFGASLLEQDCWKPVEAAKEKKKEGESR